MIRLDGITVAAGSFRLHGISLEVPAGGYGLIIGPTGAGKTTLLEAIAGHLPIEEGAIWLGSRDVTALPPEARGVGVVYQSYQLFPHLRVRDNIAYGLGRAAGREARVRELAEVLGIAPLLDRAVQGLSGGEQQRVALARALAPAPRVLLLDEPFAALDPALRRVLRRELQQIREREGVAILHVTHDVEDALRLGDVVAVLGHGTVAQVGPPERVFRFPGSPFVADFLGAGTVLKGTVTRVGDTTGPDARFPARFESDHLSLEVIAEREGFAHAVIRPEDLLVSRTPFGEQPRNRFPARVARLERMGPVTMVYLMVGDLPLSASITTANADALALAPGDTAMIAIKATTIHLI